MVSNSDQEPVLVIGATGRHGGTGARVVERLQAAGRLVRALVRSDDEGAERLRQSGVQALVGDLHDRRTLLPALDGVDSVYVAYPVAAGIVDALANVASVIRELGTSPHVVIMASGAADPNSPSGIARAHDLSEELLLQLGVNFTAVPGSAFFYEKVHKLPSYSIPKTPVVARGPRRLGPGGGRRRPPCEFRKLRGATPLGVGRRRRHRMSGAMELWA